MKNLQQFRNDNTGEWGHHYHFIWQCTSIKSEAKIVLQFMLNEFDMNGHIRWTRQKYSELSGVSYNTVRRLFDALQQQHILKPIKDTSNYNLDFDWLYRSVKANKLTALPVNKTALPGSTTALPDNETALPGTKTALGGQHIDNKDLIENKDLYREEGAFSAPSSQGPKSALKTNGINNLEFEQWLKDWNED